MNPHARAVAVVLRTIAVLVGLFGLFYLAVMPLLGVWQWENGVINLGCGVVGYLVAKPLARLICAGIE